jgi:3-oxoacyl-[acyl-carrier-protein] synthase-3
MGACIEAVGALASRGLRKPSARRLADTAAQRCLALAGREAGDVDVLINAGVYREDSMGEPALAGGVVDNQPDRMWSLGSGRTNGSTAARGASG